MANASERTDGKPKLLLHICCAPCATWVFETLKREFEITGFFYDPNIQPREEYDKRRWEAHRFAREAGFAIVDGEYDVENWRRAVRGHEDEPEGGRRWALCYDFRLARAAQYAARRGFQWLATTLTISPHKRADVVNPTGSRLCRQYGLRFLEADFKKRAGFEHSVRLSREHGLYRQDYCGCEFSRRERDERRERMGRR